MIFGIVKLNLINQKFRFCRKEKSWQETIGGGHTGKPIEIENSCQYLGILLAPTLSWDQHFQNKTTPAKLAINVMFSTLLNNKYSVGFKIQLLNQCYVRVFRSGGIKQ